uniref:Retrotransposon gag domain-containing protein n=1 Tax=Arundo donax TaxID=35708 RepID=A0A0A8XZM8_ARUDO
MWVTAASLHMEGNAACWLQVYKLQHGLGSWEQFMQAVEEKFGADDYRKSMAALLSLKQTGSVEEYAKAFEQIRYQVSMHNIGFDETFFVSHFVRGLKEDIRGSVQSQVPLIVDRAIMLALVQQEVLENSKARFTKSFHNNRSTDASYKPDNKYSNTSGDLWKARQLWEYRKQNGLCFYYGEKFEPGHAEKCSKRVTAQLHALSISDLQMELTDEVLAELEREDLLASELAHLSLNAISGTEGNDTI